MTGIIHIDVCLNAACELAAENFNFCYIIGLVLQLILTAGFIGEPEVENLYWSKEKQHKNTVQMLQMLH